MWTSSVLPSLAGLAKAMYQSAELVSFDGATAVLRVENEHHRQNCERKRGDVEAAFASAAGTPVAVRLEVDGSASTDRPGPSTSAPSPAPMSDDPDEHLAGADVHDLDDAPDAPLGGIAALTEAFPGSEVIDE